MQLVNGGCKILTQAIWLWSLPFNQQIIGKWIACIPATLKGILRLTIECLSLAHQSQLL